MTERLCINQPDDCYGDVIDLANIGPDGRCAWCEWNDDPNYRACVTCNYFTHLDDLDDIGECASCQEDRKDER